MKKIGIIGGLGPESTVDYYKEIISAFNTKYADLAYPEIIVYSANLNEFMEFINKKQWQKIPEWLLDKILAIHQAGAEFAAIASNTPHIVFEEIESRSPIPLLSIVECTCAKAHDMGLKNIGLMGTKLTMEADFYKNRRYRMAVNLTYARPYSHDQAYFQDPLKMLNGLIEPPRFNLRNEVMVRKHVHATILTVLFQLARNDAQLPASDRDEIKETLALVFPRQIRDYLFDSAGNVRGTPLDVSSLQTIVTKHLNYILEHLEQVFAQYWPQNDAFVVETDCLKAMATEMTSILQEVIRTLKRRLDWAMDQLARLARRRQQRGVLDAEEEALERRCNRLIKRLKGVQRRQRREVEGYDDISTYSVLAAEGFLPGYGLEIGSVRATAQLPRRLAMERDYDLPRSAALALREYVPGNLIYANNHKFTPRFYHLSVEEEHIDPLLFNVDTANEAVSEIGAGDGGAGLGGQVLRAIPICDVDLPHQAHITDNEELRFQLPVAIWGYEQNRHGPGVLFHWGNKDVTFRSGVHFRLVNVGTPLVLARGMLGYPVCLVCGQSRSPLSSERERENFAEDHRDRCGQHVASTGYYADVVADALVIQECEDREEAFSIAEALRMGASRVLDMEPEDLQILPIPHPGAQQIDIVIYDPMPGGSGLLDQMCDRWSEVVSSARNVVEECASGCERACVDCLLTFRNAFYHRHLNRHVAWDRFETWGNDLEKSHDIPANLPAGVETRDGEPASDKEQRFREMLSRAGFPEPIRGHSIQLGRPLGSTTPDCFYAGEDEEDPGTCIYLDGLSRMIHGDPVVSRRDREIREELRARHYEVFEIPASHLDDRGAMSRHFYRLARVLMGRDRARDIREETSWFKEAD